MSELKAYNVICTNDISEDYDVDALGATDFEAYALGAQSHSRRNQKSPGCHGGCT